MQTDAAGRTSEILRPMQRILQEMRHSAASRAVRCVLSHRHRQSLLAWSFPVCPCLEFNRDAKVAQLYFRMRVRIHHLSREAVTIYVKLRKLRLNREDCELTRRVA